MPPRPTKVLSLRELQMAKRMLKSNKVPACQRELNALLNAMDRKEKGDGNVNIRILQTALEHCLHASVRVSLVRVVGGWGMVGAGCVCLREGGRKGVRVGSR